jgi:3-deoxy-D-manno-octulosonate 8-phosphate phosphatase (KDO 8-P phosphatase)
MKRVREAPRAVRANKAKREAPTSLTTRLKRVKLLLCDVDGVLTDASIFVGGEREVKRFDIQDGLGLVLLRRAGIKVGWVSSRPSPATELRAIELKIDFLVQTREKKVVAVENLLARTGLNWEQVCYAGDDVVDLGAIQRAGVGVAVANAVAEAKQLARYVTEKSGGHGAVREVAEMILKAQGLWEPILAEHTA